MIYHQSVFADLLTPVSAFLRVADGADRAFLLESVGGGETIGRHSFIGVNPERTFQGSFGDFRTRFPETQPTRPDLPPFTGGAVGVLCYDTVREFERLPDLKDEDQRAAPGVSPLVMDFYPTVLAFDHVKHEITIMSHRGMDKVEEMKEKLLSSGIDRQSPLGGRHTLVTSRPSENAGQRSVCTQSSFTVEAFESAVHRAKEYIRAGDIFQVVLSQRFEVDFERDPFNVYRALRYINPSPYLFF